MMQQIREQQAKVFDQQVKAGKITQAQADQTNGHGRKIFRADGDENFRQHAARWFQVSRAFSGGRWCCGCSAWWSLKSKFDFLKALEVAGLATMISVLGTVVTMLLTVIFGKATAPSLALLGEPF